MVAALLKCPVDTRQLASLQPGSAIKNADDLFGYFSLLDAIIKKNTCPYLMRGTVLEPEIQKKYRAILRKQMQR